MSIIEGDPEAKTDEIEQDYKDRQEILTRRDKEEQAASYASTKTEER